MKLSTECEKVKKYYFLHHVEGIGHSFLLRYLLKFTSLPASLACLSHGATLDFNG